MIGVVCPTRGMLFTRVAQYLEELKNKHDIKVYYSFDQPIPEGHNILVEQALQDGNEYIFFLEEDVVPPPGAFEKMLAADVDIACIDYGVAGWGCVTRNPQGEVLWCGVGCTLVKRAVFEVLEKPYFRVDQVLSENDWTWKQLPEEYIKTKNYGTLDIWFCWQARAKGFKIIQIDGEECEHLRLDKLGERETNHGLHKISLKPKIEKRQIKDVKGGEN